MEPQPEDRNSESWSGAPWEIELMHQQFPTHPHKQLVEVLEDCKKELHGTEDRDKLLNCVSRKLA